MKRLPTVYHLMVPLAVALLAPSGARLAFAQGTALPPVKVDLPPPPNFNVQTAPEKYPSGEMSIFGLRKHMSQYLDKDVQYAPTFSNFTNARRSSGSATTLCRTSRRRTRRRNPRR
jgi:hypothetical protein